MGPESNMTRLLIQRGNLDTVSNSQQNIRNQEKGVEHIFPLAVFRRYQPRRHLDLGLLVSRTVR